MKIALLGDIAFFGRFSKQNNTNLEDYFKKISQRLATYDLVVGNLETPFAKDEHVPIGYKSAYIKSEPLNVSLLKYLNIGVVNLANNHIYDYGAASFELTKQLLDEHGIKYFGIDNKELRMEHGGNVLAFNGYCCYSTNPLGINRGDQSGINELDFREVSTRLQKNRNFDQVDIFSVHCGQEHVNYPNYDHVQLARKLSEIGPYIFYGHHPHVAQGIEEVNNSLIAYSLGNFCFDDVYTSKSKFPLVKQTQNNKESFLLEIEIENNRVVGHAVVPFFIGDREIVLDAPQILKKIQKYSVQLKEEKESYNRYRNRLWMSYINDRKKKRDFNWYYKRLNFRTIGLILSSRSNARKYRKCISDHLDA